MYNYYHSTLLLCGQVGCICIDFPTGWSVGIRSRHEYHLDVSMKFGGADIIVETSDPQSGAKLQTNVSFSSFRLGA